MLLIEDLFLDGSGVRRRGSAREAEAGNSIPVARKAVGPKHLAIRQIKAMEFSLGVCKNTLSIRKHGYEFTTHAPGQFGFPQDVPIEL
jgi:hypothetical protein